MKPLANLGISGKLTRATIQSPLTPLMLLAAIIVGLIATAIRYEHVEKDGHHRYNVNFLLDGKSVVRLKDLDTECLADAVGDKNAASILASKERRGALKGEALLNEYGLSPNENTRRMMLKEE